MHLPSEDLVDAVAVGDSRWFTDAAGCDRALAQHARVATDLTQCEFEPFVPDAVQQATRRSFEELLRRGGVAYAVEGDAGVSNEDPEHRDPERRGGHEGGGGGWRRGGRVSIPGARVAAAASRHDVVDVRAELAGAREPHGDPVAARQ
ncbi:MAG: hypothetical protein R3B06_04545 [Kofleriaceae bacterium]